MTWYKSAAPKIMYIMRGPSGAGKSTKAREMGISGTVLSTDDFWMKDGQYQFDQARIGEAHAWNQQRARECLKKGMSPLIIDNTNIEAWEMKPYVGMAQQYGYQVQLVAVDVKNSPEELAARNKHGVPADVIGKMIEKYNPKVTVRDVLKSQPPDQKIAQTRIPYGEFWIDNDGVVMHADGDIGDMSHASHVCENILSARNLSSDFYEQLRVSQYPLQDGSKDIYEALRKKGLKNDEIAILNGKGDPNLYAMKNWGWKRIAGNSIETWKLTPNDLSAILHGLNNEIAFEDEDGTSEWNIEVGQQTAYWNIPLNIMDKGVPAIIRYHKFHQQTPTKMSLPNGVQAGWFGKLKISSRLSKLRERRPDLVDNGFFEKESQSIEDKIKKVLKRYPGNGTKVWILDKPKQIHISFGDWADDVGRTLKEMRWAVGGAYKIEHEFESGPPPTPDKREWRKVQ